MTDQPAPMPLKERLYRTEAIVLGQIDYAEADRILTVYTPRFGKFRVIAKGARRPLSRFGPHIGQFARCRLMLARGRELDVVTGAETIDTHGALGRDLDAYAHAAHCCELVGRLTEDRQENPAAFEVLAGSLRLLADGVEPAVVARHFELALLTLLGYRPELYRCVACERDLAAEPNFLSHRLGGMLCPTCRTADAGAVPVTVNAQKYLRALDRQGLAYVARLPVDAELAREVEHVVGGYLRHLTERELNSLGVLRTIRDASPPSPA